VALWRAAPCEGPRSFTSIAAPRFDLEFGRPEWGGPWQTVVAQIADLMLPS